MVEFLETEAITDEKLQIMKLIQQIKPKIEIYNLVKRKHNTFFSFLICSGTSNLVCS